jgi:hypothetical protein
MIVVGRSSGILSLAPGSGVVGNARALGARDRGFESRLPDHAPGEGAVTEAGRDDGPASRRYRTNRLEGFGESVLAIAIFFRIPLGAF